ncbi:MAG: hypothetical protein U5R06_20145 [candidate division KSB1 bacterium]|nr:hypothetical protein [candidate division KSB1 bacterium]
MSGHVTGRRAIQAGSPDSGPAGGILPSFSRIWYDSGDEQKNESFYLTVRSQSGDMLTPQDANAGPYKVVADIPGLPQDPWEGPVDSSVTVLWRDAGRFYLPEGEHFIYMNHYARIVTEYPQFLQDSLGPTESVRLFRRDPASV